MDAPKLKPDLVQRFLYHATHNPSKLAILTSSQQLSYQQLLEEVLIWKSAFSTGLQGPVVVCLDRTPRVLAVLLALQWLNIPYVPVDSNIPPERLRYLIEDSQAKTLLYDQGTGFKNLPCLCLDLRSPLSTQQIQCPLNASPLAYIIYTSGSTGKPKGVAISRKALNHFLSCMSAYFMNDADEMLLAITTLAFDIAALELYLPIWQGKTVFLSHQQEHQDPQALTELLESYPITLLQATPSMWSMLKHLNWKGQPKLTALCGGERLSESLATYLLSHVGSL
ncbi:MAG: AMP-binding protein, partial [Methylococcales bacterium]|nr:AMP-binding protein [Methylococcales bacterium]